METTTKYNSTPTNFDETDLIRSKPEGFRFMGWVTRLGPDFAFLRVYNTTIEVFLHREIANETIRFDCLKVGDKLRFAIRQSQTHAGKWVAGRVGHDGVITI